ncbi:hypothetical protein BGZ83_003264, partial [Gryganskiella cystojenkinii]
MASRRTSSVPSLTSTNDPFQTFDSNEIILVEPECEGATMGRDPFADQIEESDQQVVESTSPSGYPQPPSLKVITESFILETQQEDRSNSALLRSFPDPPSPPTSPISPILLRS